MATTSPAVCPDCNGTGWRIVERDEISGASRCTCVATERAGRLFGECELPLLYQNASFDNFSTLQDSELTKVFLTVRAYVRDFPNTAKPGLLLMGDPGSGKTHLAVAALRAVVAKGFEGLFFDYQNLLDRIRSSYDPTSHTSDKETYRVAMEKEVLLLDDLGAHRVTDWVEDTVTSIITARCNHRKPLIATTNLIDPDAGYVTYEGTGSGKVDHRTTLAERVGARARSRLFEMCRVIKMPSLGDYRVRKQNN
jgi:DNA replication protein DnaC